MSIVNREAVRMAVRFPGLWRIRCASLSWHVSCKYSRSKLRFVNLAPKLPNRYQKFRQINTERVFAIARRRCVVHVPPVPKIIEPRAESIHAFSSSPGNPSRHHSSAPRARSCAKRISGPQLFKIVVSIQHAVRNSRS